MSNALAQPTNGKIAEKARPKTKRATLSELSAHLGLSKPTLSRALNNYPDIAEETKARVRAAAEALGYKASSRARQLSSGRAEAVGLITVMSSLGLRSAYQSEFMNALALGLADLGHDLLLHVVDDASKEVEAYERLAQEGKVDGFVVMRTQVQDPRIAFLTQAAIPFVTQGRVDGATPHAWLDVDAEQGFYQVTKHLLSLGHQRLGYVRGDQKVYSSHLRDLGVARAMGEAGQDLVGTFDGDFSAEAGADAVRQSLKQGLDLSALICANDAMAMGAVSEACRQGLRVPQDLSVTGYDGVRLAEMFNPPITTLSHSAADCGADMASMIVGLIQGQDPKGLQKLVQPALIQRGSTTRVQGGSPQPPKGLI